MVSPYSALLVSLFGQIRFFYALHSFYGTAKAHTLRVVGTTFAQAETAVQREVF